MGGKKINRLRPSVPNASDAKRGQTADRILRNISRASQQKRRRTIIPLQTEEEEAAEQQEREPRTSTPAVEESGGKEDLPKSHDPKKSGTQNNNREETKNNKPSSSSSLLSSGNTPSHPNNPLRVNEDCAKNARTWIQSVRDAHAIRTEIIDGKRWFGQRVGNGENKKKNKDVAEKSEKEETTKKKVPMILDAFHADIVPRVKCLGCEGVMDGNRIERCVRAGGLTACWHQTCFEDMRRLSLGLSS